MPWPPDILQHAFTFERVIVTPYTFATIFLPTLFTYYVMAVLVQLPRTALYRAALLPIVLWMTFRTNMSLDFSFNNPSYDYLNHGTALGIFMIAMRCTAWVFVRRPYTRLPICRTVNATICAQNGDTSVTDGVSVSSAMWNACNLALNVRLIGWNESQPKHIPAPYFRVESRRIFALLCLCQVIFWVPVLDVVCRTIRSFGPDTLGSINGGTIFDPLLPPLERFMKASAVSVLSAGGIYAIVQAIYNLDALVFTILFQQHPSQWPPLFNCPWISTSLATFWGRRWHQMLRESVVGIASPLLGGPFGQIGTIMGAFALSGVMHDVGARGMCRGGDTIQVVGFFLIHGVGVALEYAWKRTTGKRVGGVIGWLWTASWFLLSGPVLIDAWSKRGLLGSEFWPEAYSPTTLILNGMSWKNGSL